MRQIHDTSWDSAELFLGKLVDAVEREQKKAIEVYFAKWQAAGDRITESFREKAEGMVKVHLSRSRREASHSFRSDLHNGRIEAVSAEGKPTKESMDAARGIIAGRLGISESQLAMPVI